MNTTASYLPTYARQIVIDVVTETYLTDTVIIPCFEDIIPELPAELVKRHIAGGKDPLREIASLNIAEKGRQNSVYIIIRENPKKTQKILLVGLGCSQNLNINVLRDAVGTAIKALDTFKTDDIVLILPRIVFARLGIQDVGKAIAEGAIIASYKYTRYITATGQKEENQTSPKKKLSIASEKEHRKELKKGIDKGCILAEAQNIARAITNEPANKLTPQAFAEIARKTKEAGIRCRILSERELRELKMEGILSVGTSSENRPLMIILEYIGRKVEGKKRKECFDIGLVGKAITFDSGGLSIKPANSMENMKYDKAGGAAIMGIVYALSRLKAKVNVVAAIPVAENLPSSTSYKPGDIIQSYSGRTIEVINTDAEGRLLLADALSYLVETKRPSILIDIATLTGGCVIALGKVMAGVFCNRDELFDKIKDITKLTGEKIARLPLDEEYNQMIKSKVADLKNSAGKEASPCTAAAFLSSFVGDTPWIHFDIAGMAYITEEKPYMYPGATGFGVRTITEYILKQS